MAGLEGESEAGQQSGRLNLQNTTPTVILDGLYFGKPLFLVDDSEGKNMFACLALTSGSSLRGSRNASRHNVTRLLPGI